MKIKQNATKFDALRWLWKNHKVRLKGWLPSAYLILTSGEKIVNQTGNFVNINDYTGEWELKRPEREGISLSDAQVRAIKLLLMDNNITYEEMSKVFGKTKNYITAILNKNGNISADHLRIMCEHLKIPYEIIANTHVKTSDLFKE